MTLFGNKRTYLDWAAAAPVHLEAQIAFVRALKIFGNPSSPHTEGVAALRLLETARAEIARLLEVKDAGVVFTSGATEANNLALRGVVMHLREHGTPASGIHVLYLPSAHASVTKTVSWLAAQGVATEALSFKDGGLDCEDLSQKLRPTTRIVSIDGVCGETGMKYASRTVRNTLDAFSKKNQSTAILLHVDASQMPLAHAFDLTRLSADIVTLDASKVGGVRGIGVLAMRSNVRLSSIVSGGAQEHGLRAGTEPVALACAFSAALASAARGREAFTQRAWRIREKLVQDLSTRISPVYVNEAKDTKEQAPHIVNLSLPGRDTDYLVMLLDNAGFAVSTKSACESDHASGSRAVQALTGDPARAESTLRISWGPTTRERDLERFTDTLCEAVAFLDAGAA